MTDGEFIDFETLNDWRERDLAKDAEIERLRAALAPFDDAYRLAVGLCKSLTLGDWEAMAKHHTAPGSYRSACLVLEAKESDK